MKLILASDLSFLLKYGYDLTGISKSDIKIGRIITASKGEGEKTQLFIKKVKDTIIENGYSIEDIDIKDKSEEEIRNFFKDKNVIHVEGGNTYYLLKVIKESGFGEILKELLEDGKVYIGTSAGAYIMCPTIEVTGWKRDESDVNDYGVTDLTAFNYVPFVLKVHYEDKEEELVKEKIKTLKYPLHILRDGQAILVEDGNYKFVGDGEEVKLN